MRQREKKALLLKQAIKDAERVAKLICPFCKHGIGRLGTVHLLDRAPHASTGGWVECFAKEVLEGVAIHLSSAAEESRKEKS